MTGSAVSSRRYAPVFRAYLRRDWVVLVWVFVLTLAVLAPTLVPGFVLSYDMVFVPQQSLLPQSFGIGGGLPRAVPQDAVMGVATLIADGQWVQKLVLIAIFVLAGVGVSRLLARYGRGAQLLGATLAIWNPFVAERLVLGHWALLLAYSIVPFVVLALQRFRASGQGMVPLLLWCALGSLVPTGGLILALLVLTPTVFPGGQAELRRRLGVVAGLVVINLPWLLPAVTHPVRGTSSIEAAQVFALRAEGSWGEIITAISFGGVWNAEVVLASRGWFIAPVLGVALWLLALAGIQTWLRTFDPVIAWWIITLGVGGFILAISPAVFPTLWGWAITSLPGAGILRDSHKWLLMIAMLVAIVAPVGLIRVLRLMKDPINRRVIIASVLLLPIVAMPDFIWGATGRLAAAAYPNEWYELRDYLGDQASAGDVLVLPWSTFRRFEFNGNRTVLDPAPRWLPRGSVTSDSLAIARDGGITLIEGDDPRSAVVGRFIASGQPLAELPPELGLGWVLVERGQLPEVEMKTLAGLEQGWSQGDLVLYRLVKPPEVIVLTNGQRVIIGVNAAVGLWLLVLLAATVVRSRPSRRSIPGEQTS